MVTLWGKGYICAESKKKKGAVVTCNELTSHIIYFKIWKAMHFSVLQYFCGYWKQSNLVVSLKVVLDSWMIRRWVCSQGISSRYLYGSRSLSAHSTLCIDFCQLAWLCNGDGAFVDDTAEQDWSVFCNEESSGKERIGQREYQF